MIGMKTKVKVAFVINLLVMLGILTGAIQYLLATQINSYHRAMSGMEWSAMGSGLKTLLLILMKGTGTASLVCAVSLIFLLFIPYRRLEDWARWAVLAVVLALCVPALVGILYFDVAAKAPWKLIASLTLLAVVAFFVSGNLGKGKKATGKSKF